MKSRPNSQMEQASLCNVLCGAHPSPMKHFYTNEMVMVFLEPQKTIIWFVLKQIGVC